MNWSFSLERRKKDANFCKGAVYSSALEEVEMCPVGDTAPMFTQQFWGQLAWRRQQRTLSGVSGCHSRGHTCSGPWPSEGTGGQEEREVQSYSSKAAVEEIDFQHFGLAILN